MRWKSKVAIMVRMVLDGGLKTNVISNEGRYIEIVKPHLGLQLC